jgi:hypothetical protein
VFHSDRDALKSSPRSLADRDSGLLDGIAGRLPRLAVGLPQK